MTGNGDSGVASTLTGCNANGLNDLGRENYNSVSIRTYYIKFLGIPTYLFHF